MNTGIPFIDVVATRGVGKISDGDVSSLISGAFDMAIAAGTIFAVLRIVYAGWLYMGWADAAGEKSKGKEVFSDAIIGLIILYGIWLILNQINPCLLEIRIFQSSNSTNCAETRYRGDSAYTPPAAEPGTYYPY